MLAVPLMRIVRDVVAQGAVEADLFAAGDFKIDDVFSVVVVALVFAVEPAFDFGELDEAVNEV